MNPKSPEEREQEYVDTLGKIVEGTGSEIKVHPQQEFSNIDADTATVLIGLRAAKEAERMDTKK